MSLYPLLTCSSSYSKRIKDKIKTINIHITELNQMMSENIFDAPIPVSSNKEKKDVFENMIYTDGSCSKNGSKKATGGCGIYIFSSALGSNIKLGKQISPSTGTYQDVTYSYPVSNIRTEGYAILYTMYLFSHHYLYKSFSSSSTSSLLKWLNTFSLPPLESLKTKYSKTELYIKKNTTKKQIHIFTDSKFWIDVYTSWMPTWIHKGILLEKKNIDLLLYGYYYHTLLHQNNIEVVFHHVYAHQKGKQLDVHAIRNNEVDEIAVRANTESTDTQFHIFE